MKSLDTGILANYDRFRGSRRANVEVHGGASMEEVAVPIIEITQKASNIEAFIVDESRVLTLGAKEYAIIKIYVGIRSNNISINWMVIITMLKKLLNLIYTA